MSEHIHVCLVSDQVMANLVPLLFEKPDRAIFLTSPTMKPQAKRLTQIVSPRGIRVDEKEIAPYSFAQVSETCKGIINAHQEDRLTLNVTGGTKISALAAFQVFFFENQRIIYQDTSSDRLLQLGPVESETQVKRNLVGPKEYLAAHGLLMTNDGLPSSGYQQRAALLPDLADLLVENERLQGTLNHLLGENWSKAGYANVELNRLGPEAERLADLLARCGVAHLGVGVINVQGDENRFFCQGGWLEEYVYHEVNKLQIKGARPRLNVKVQWDEAGRRQTSNEFDVLFTSRNRLFIISCKTANLEREHGTPAKEALYELDSLADKAGGLFGQALLVSSRRLSEYDRARAEKMRIKVCDGPQVLRLGDWLRKVTAPPSSAC